MSDRKKGGKPSRRMRKQARKNKVTRSPSVVETAASVPASAVVDVIHAVSETPAPALPVLADPIAETAPPMAAVGKEEPHVDVAGVADDAARFVDADPTAVTAGPADRDSDKPDGDKPSDLAPEASTDTFSALARVADFWMREHHRLAQAQAAWGLQMIGFWSHTLRRLAGQTDARLVPHETDAPDATTGDDPRL